MASLHPELTDKDYWDLRLRLFDLQCVAGIDDAVYEELRRDLVDDLHNYLITLAEELDPWS